MLQQRPKLKVVFMTGYSEKAMFPEDLQRHRFPILTKPFTGQALNLTINQALQDEDNP